MSTASEINASMARLVPELRDSPYGKYPMEGSTWLKPNETTPEGKPAFIACSKQGELKQHYVWGPGTYGFGYYHLQTKEAYVILKSRLRKDTEPDAGCCGGSAKPSKDKEEAHDIRQIFYFRSQSPVPNDHAARKHGYELGKGFRPDTDLNPLEIKPSNITW